MSEGEVGGGSGDQAEPATNPIFPNYERVNELIFELYGTRAGKLGINHLERAIAHFQIPFELQEKFREHLTGLSLLGKKARVIMSTDGTKLANAEQAKPRRRKGEGPTHFENGGRSGGFRRFLLFVKRFLLFVMIVGVGIASYFNWDRITKFTTDQVAALTAVSAEPDSTLNANSANAPATETPTDNPPTPPVATTPDPWVVKKTDYIAQISALPHFQRVLQPSVEADRWSLAMAQELAGTLETPYKGNWAANAHSEYPVFVAWATEFWPTFQTDRVIEPQWVKAWLAYRDLVGVRSAGVISTPDPFTGSKTRTVAEILSARGITVLGVTPEFAETATFTQSHWNSSKAIFLEVINDMEKQYLPQ